MSSFRDLVKKANGGKNTDTNKEEKRSSFKDLVTNVNKGTIKVTSTLNSSQVNDWYKGVSLIGKNAYNYLKAEGYKNPDTSYLDQIDTYLSQANDVGQYLRANKSSLSNYEEMLQNYNDTVSYLQSLRSGVKRSNSFYSDFKDEEDYNFWDEHSTVEKRQSWYEEQQAQLYDMGSYLDNYYWIDHWYRDYQERPWAYTEEEIAKNLDLYNKHVANRSKYGTDKDVKNEIAAIEAEMRNYERGNYNENGRFYGSKVDDDYYKVTQNPDFGVVSVNRDFGNPTRDELTEYDALTDSSTWYYDANNVLRDAYGNEIVKDSSGNLVNPKAKDYAIKDRLGLFLSATDRDIEEYMGTIVSGTWGNIIGEGIDGSWNQLEKDEIDIYYYLLNTSGQETADKYLSDMKTELNRRETLSDIDRWHESYDEASFLEKIALNAATIPAKFLSNITGTVTNAVDTLQGKDINPYSFAHSGMHFSQTVRGDTAEELDETGFNIPLIDFSLGDIYQTGMSRLDSALATSVFGGGGTVFLGMGAAQEEAYRLYQQGASEEQITWGAFAAGAAEAVFEYASFDKLVKMENADTIWKWVKSALVQGGIEASEETFTEVSNIITNAVIMGQQSDLAELHEQNGGDWSKTGLSLVQQVAHAAFGGFIGGALAGGVQGGKSYFNTQAQYANAGEKIMDSVGGADALKNLANEVAGVSDAKMQKSLNKQAASLEKKATNRKVGKLYNTVKTAYNAQNKADIVTILEMNKFSSETANTIADAIVALASGNLTEQQAGILEMYKDNEHVQGVINSYDYDERSSIGKRNKAMGEFNYGVAFSAEAKKYTEKTFTPEGKYAVSSDGEAKALVTEEVEGKTITKDTGDVINIKGIASIRKGKMLLDIGDGKTIDSKNVAYATKNDALIYEAIANLGDNIDADTANKLISKFDGGNAMVFARGIAQAYTYGFYGLDRSEMKGKHTLSAELTETQRNYAYGLGEKYRPVKDAKAKSEAKVKKAPGEKGVYYRDKNGNATDIRTYLDSTKIGLKDVQKTAIEVMEKMSEMMGVRFNVFESWVENGKRYYLDENGDVTEGNPNGFYDTLTGEIYIDLNAGQDYQGTMLFTVAHELTHFMRQWSPEQFTKISKLVFQHGGMKGSVAKLAAIKQAKAKAKGKPISYDTAVEEVVADGMETILKDGKVLEFMEDVKKTDHEAWAKLKEWFQKLADLLKELVNAYRVHSAQTVEGAKVAEFAEDLLTQIKQLYAEGAVDAGQTYQMAIGNVKVSNQITMEEDVIDSSNTGISKQAKTGAKMQERTEFEAQPKQVFRVSTTNGEAESKMLGTNKSVKELRDANFKENGFSKEEVDKINGFIKEMADNMTKYRLKYKFIGLQNIHDAKIILDPMNGKIVLSAMVNNSDYSVNFDFTKICKKRVALQEVLETLAREKGKVTDGKVTEVNLSPANIKHINDILASYGVETACLCCFVESKRYNIQNYYQEKVVDVWNMLVDEVAPDAGYFNFADSDVDTSKIPDSEFADLEMQMKEWAGKTGKAKDVEQKMREFLADSPAARKKLRFSDLVTANGRTNLHKLYPEIESLILSKLGQSAPKSVEAFTPYNGEIDLLEAKSDGDIVKYLYSIAGVRSQSFSDFMIAHVFDVLQKTASMSARKMPAHVYTKEIARAMLFGMTGEKHNMSVLHNVDPSVDSWSAGLSKDGEYNFSDYEAYKKGYSEFVQSIGWKDAVTLQNTEGYSKDCGIIGVGFSYNHMLKLHNDPEVRQVIGYHTSQMPVEVKPLTHLDKAADYTKVQNTMRFVGFAKPNYAIPEGVPSYATPPQDVTYKGNKTTKVSDTFDLVGTFNKLSKGKKGDARTAAAKETLRQLLEYANDHGYVITTASGEAGKGEFDLYGDVQNTQNPYLTTDHYIEYCIERGMLPMFFEFSMNPNYYKDIFDFNVFDRKSYNPETGLHEDSEGRKAYAPQTAVHMLNEDGSLAFPENFFDIVDKQMNSYNRYMQDVNAKMPSIMDEVRAVTNSTSKLSDRDKYWYPNMTKTEIEEVRGIAKFEAKKTDNYLGIDSKWLYTNSKGHRYFALYSDIDSENPTVLYACKDKRAEFEHQILVTEKQREENNRERINTDAGFVGRLLNGIEDAAGGKGIYSGYTVGAGGNNGNAAIYSRYKGIKPSEAFLNCVRNIKEIQQQYGLDAHYQLAVDRGDYYTAQTMVNESADAAGFTTSGYHGSRTPGFTVVDKYSWLWLARDKSVANEYGTYTEVDNIGKPHDKNGVYAMRYNLGNNLVVYADGASWGELPVTEDEYPGVYTDEETGDITTNAMAEWAERNGYDSISFVDVMDGGGSPTTVDVVFNPNRDAKSADPVTYDDNGEVIPLSQRFNKANDDIRYSDRDTDGNQLTEDQQEFFADSKARDENGNLYVLFHGSRSPLFTEFDMYEGVWLTPDQRYAEVYAETWRSWRGENEGLTGLESSVYADPDYRLYKMYANITNPLDIGEINEEFDNKQMNRLARLLGVPASRIRNISHHDGYQTVGYVYEVTRDHQFIEIAKEKGYDGFAATEKGKKTFCAFNAPNQVKLTTNEVPSSFYDIRYSDRDYVAYDRTAIIKEETVDRWLRAYATKYTPNYAQAYIAYMKPDQFLELTTSDYVARKYIESESSELDEEKFAKATSDQPLFLDIDHETGEVYGHEGRHRCVALQNAGIESVPVLLFDTSNKYSKEDISSMLLKGQFNKYHREFLFDAIPLSYENRDRVIQNFATQSSSQRFWEKAGTKNTLRFQDRGNDSVSNRALLANAFEGLAQNDIEKNKIKEYKEKITLINEEERKLRELNAQIKELSFSKGPRDTKKIKGLRFDAAQTANRINTYDKQLLRLEASKPLQDVLNREKRRAYKKAEERGKEALADYKAKVEVKQKETTEKWRESRKAAVAKARETAEKRDARAKLQKLVLDTVKWLSYPAKTDVKCPDILKKPYEAFLQGIDLSSKRLANGGEATKNDLRLANAMGSLATALDKIMISQDPTQDVDKVLDTDYLDLPADFVQKLRDMTENIKAMMIEGDYVVNNMTAAEVRQISQMIRTLNHAIKTMSNLYANLRFANVEALGFDTMEFMDALGEIEKTGGMKDFVQWDNALPYYAFKRFGKGGESVFEGLMDAQDKLAFLAKAIFDFQEKTWTGKEAKEWSEDTHTIPLPNGNELTLTTADAMSIYCLSRREQGLQHLLGGGTRVLGIQKGSKKAKDSRSLLTIKDIDAINSSLTDRQKQVAEAIQEFMSTVCSEWGNEISMKRFLTKEFTEKFYFPIESNDENLPVKDPAAQQSDLFRLLNISATKPLTPGANNEVIIRNIFDVFTGHASDMARLNAYGMALLDYMKWLNYREKTANEEGQINVRGVRKSIEQAYGNAAKSYVLNLVKDVNGRPSDGGDPAFWMKWMRAAKTASVGSSLRVATLQITSYPRAALVLSPKSLALGLSKVPQIDKAKEYCGIALWKSFGFYDTNISRSIEDQMKGVTDVKQKLIELSLKGAEWGDAITWGALWNACEYEVAQTTKNKVGSEEFYQEVANKLREVVYRTQVVDSTLTRSQIMRSKRGMAQEAAAFMSEPTLSANILMDAGFEFNAEKRRTGSVKTAWNKTGKYIGRAVAVYAIGQLTAALLEGLWDAWRDEEDEEFGEKYMSAFVQNLVLDLLPLNKLPILSDAVDLVMAQFGLGFYSSDRMSTTWLTQTNSALQAWKDALSGESSVTVYNALYKTTRAISSFFGVAVSGVMREAVALWNNTAGAYDLTLKILTYDRTDEELGELLLDAFLEGNDRQAESLKAEFEEEDDSKKAVRKAVKNRYEAGDIDDDTAKQYLVKYAGMADDKAYWAVEEWRYKTETGEEFSQYNDFYEAVRTGKNLKAVIKEYTDHGVKSSNLAGRITDHFKPLYKGMTKSERASIKGYLLNAYELLGYDRSKKSKDIDKWVED